MMNLVLSAPNGAAEKPFLRKGDYRTCHIQLLDTQERVAAISFGSKLYSYFTAITVREKALKVLGKLEARGDDAVITQTPKAFILWTLEEEAVPLNKVL
ncbi:MAG: hypothetical protein WA902_22005 [Thermosynechococcaceae cyanobacterium]